MLDEGNTAIFAKSILDEERLARQQLSELQDRHDEFIKLEASIKEVHDMFVEVAQLVADQGINNNITNKTRFFLLKITFNRRHPLKTLKPGWAFLFPFLHLIAWI